MGYSPWSHRESDTTKRLILILLSNEFSFPIWQYNPGSILATLLPSWLFPRQKYVLND